MRRASSQPLLRNFQEDDETDDEEEEEEHIIIKGRSFRDVESITKQVNCITINKREHKKPYMHAKQWFTLYWKFYFVDALMPNA
ncbi:hypothetical protein ACJIZ3_005095 [Penstemon smallii]|uniref:Uncharacterized protein n=1 Tax=Penstemon smallii TaxID=265156 RepID=A0ABD3S459_9LAMI